jgi:hypothetical protein
MTTTTLGIFDDVIDNYQQTISSRIEFISKLLIEKMSKSFHTYKQRPKLTLDLSSSSSSPSKSNSLEEVSQEFIPILNHVNSFLAEAHDELVPALYERVYAEFVKSVSSRLLKIVTGRMYTEVDAKHLMCDVRHYFLPIVSNRAPATQILASSSSSSTAADARGGGGNTGDVQIPFHVKKYDFIMD